MEWIERLQQLENERLNRLIGNRMNNKKLNDEAEQHLIENKHKQLKRRKSEIVKATANGQIISKKKTDDADIVEYVLHQQFLVKQPKGTFYIEEHLVPRQAIVNGNNIIKDSLLEYDNIENKSNHDVKLEDFADNRENRKSYHYDRRVAVQYAERWWNSYNPKYKKFEVDCTNYVSQCLHEGGIPMTGFGKRNKGWWYSGESWSYSWAVAHSLRWYLSGAKQGVESQEVSSAGDLVPGDVICYDFEGDGRWNHNTIVVAKDENNEPLVNAHTYNSRMRYWAYEDSTAYTPYIKYKFFHILDGK